MTVKQGKNAKRTNGSIFMRPPPKKFLLTFCGQSRWQGGSGTEPEPETGTVGTVFPETESGTGTAGTVFQEPKPEPEPSFPVKLY